MLLCCWRLRLRKRGRARFFFFLPERGRRTAAPARPHRARPQSGGRPARGRGNACAQGRAPARGRAGRSPPPPAPTGDGASATAVDRDSGGGRAAVPAGRLPPVTASAGRGRARRRRLADPHTATQTARPTDGHGYPRHSLVAGREDGSDGAGRGGGGRARRRPVSLGAPQYSPGGWCADDGDGGAWRRTNASVSPTTVVIRLSGSASVRAGGAPPRAARTARGGHTGAVVSCQPHAEPPTTITAALPPLPPHPPPHPESSKWTGGQTAARKRASVTHSRDPLNAP